MPSSAIPPPPEWFPLQSKIRLADKALYRADDQFVLASQWLNEVSKLRDADLTDASSRTPTDFDEQTMVNAKQRFDLASTERLEALLHVRDLADSKAEMKYNWENAQGEELIQKLEQKREKQRKDRGTQQRIQSKRNNKKSKKLREVSTKEERLWVEHDTDTGRRVRFVLPEFD